MTILIVRQWRRETGPVVFAEAKPFGDEVDIDLRLMHWEENYLGWQSDKGIVTETKQTVHRIMEDGSLTYIKQKIGALPPPRKAKVINNPSKPTTNWNTHA